MVRSHSLRKKSGILGTTTFIEQKTKLGFKTSVEITNRSNINI